MAMKVEKDGMALEGVKVQIKGEEGIFTVGKPAVVQSNNKLNCGYQLTDEKGNKNFWSPVHCFMPVVGDSFDVDWHERYDITCPHCDHKMQCAPSMFHQMGCFELGGGSCPKCKQMFSIRFNPYANRMMTEKLKFNDSDTWADDLDEGCVEDW